MSLFSCFCGLDLVLFTLWWQTRVPLKTVLIPFSKNQSLTCVLKEEAPCPPPPPSLYPRPLYQREGGPRVTVTSTSSVTAPVTFLHKFNCHCTCVILSTLYHHCTMSPGPGSSPFPNLDSSQAQTSAVNATLPFPGSDSDFISDISSSTIEAEIITATA